MRTTMKTITSFTGIRKLFVAATVLATVLAVPPAIAQDDPQEGAQAPAVQPRPAQPQPAAAQPAAGADAQIIPRPPQINATAYILIDAATGSVLTEFNADNPQPPASLTKIMTTYVADSEI